MNVLDLITDCVPEKYARRIVEKKLPVTKEQFQAWFYEGKLIQDAMPQLTDAEREYIMTGLDQTQWDELWKEVEEAPYIDEEKNSA